MTDVVAGIGNNSSYQCIFDKEHMFAHCQKSFAVENCWLCTTTFVVLLLFSLHKRQGTQPVIYKPRFALDLPCVWKKPKNSENAEISIQK